MVRSSFFFDFIILLFHPCLYFFSFFFPPLQFFFFPLFFFQFLSPYFIFPFWVHSESNTEEFLVRSTNFRFFIHGPLGPVQFQSSRVCSGLTLCTEERPPSPPPVGVTVFHKLGPLSTSAAGCSGTRATGGRGRRGRATAALGAKNLVAQTSLESEEQWESSQQGGTFVGTTLSPLS
jgi:hypothetical protein